MSIVRIFIILMFVLSSISFAEEPMAPMAGFGVHTVVTLGPTVYEGEKIRAILTYGEVGMPYIFIEAIKVEMSYPVQSKVLWREEIDVTGLVLEGVPQDVFFALSFKGHFPHGNVTFHEGFKADGRQVALGDG